jgi:hypothetical protein
MRCPVTVSPRSNRRHLLLRQDGAAVAYDGTGLEPSVFITNPDGAMELRGTAQICAVRDALQVGGRLAENFGPPVPLWQWRRAHLAAGLQSVGKNDSLTTSDTGDRGR